MDAQVQQTAFNVLRILQIRIEIYLKTVTVQMGIKKVLIDV